MRDETEKGEKVEGREENCFLFFCWGKRKFLHKGKKKRGEKRVEVRFLAAKM